MENNDLCEMRIFYPLYSKESAIDAICDVCEDGAMYGPEFTWTDEDGGCFFLPCEYADTDMGRERFHLYANAGMFAQCALTGFSDMERTRHTAVIWNPHEDEGTLTLSICGGPPLNDAELKISSAIREWIPSPGWDK